MPKVTTMTGYLQFTHNGELHKAPATLTATPLNEKMFSCKLEATYDGQTQTAQFNVPDSEQQSAELAKNIQGAVKTWPSPWRDLQGKLYIQLSVTS